MKKLSELLTDESKWCKEALGRLADGTICEAANLSDAVSNCLLGAVCKIYPDETPARIDLIQKLRKAHHKLFPDRSCEFQSIFEFNDHPDTTFDDVQAVIKEVESNN